MTPLAITLISIAGFLSLIWSTRHWRISSQYRNFPPLTAEWPGVEGNIPKISVVVAAKDEEANIAACVSSLAAQEYPELEIIVCNDRSTDRTGEILDELAQNDNRIKVVHIDSLPDGWKGKNHAIHQGVKQAGGELFLFTDADCVFTSPRTISVATRLLQDRKIGMLSLLPTLKMDSFWENAIQPLCSGVMMIWFDPGDVNNPDKRNAYANGAFILATRKSYKKIGGHEAIKNEIQEDMVLGKNMKKSGEGLHVCRNFGLFSVRMYTSFGEILRGWTRIFWGSFPGVLKILISTLVIIIMGTLPSLITILGFVMASITSSNLWLTCGICGAISTVLQLSVIFRFYGLVHARKDLFWTYPFVNLIVIGILAASFLKRISRSPVTWKGTTYTN